MAAFMGNHQFPAVEATNKKDGRTEAAVSALRSLANGDSSLAQGMENVSKRSFGCSIPVL